MKNAARPASGLDAVWAPVERMIERAPWRAPAEPIEGVIEHV